MLNNLLIALRIKELVIFLFNWSPLYYNWFNVKNQVNHCINDWVTEEDTIFVLDSGRLLLSNFEFKF